jgi:hypothetical protein
VTKGTRVVITFGPYAGFEGTIVSSRKGRVVLRLQVERRWVQIELDEDMVSRTAPPPRIPEASHGNGSHKQRGSGKAPPNQ